jgi:Glycine zipper
MIGCESLPGDKKSQGAVLGGIGGALAGAAVAGDDDRGIGAMIGALAGAGGGYLIGAKVDEKDKDDAKKKEEALQASRNAEANPASADAAKQAKTADVNDDGFVTLDEVIAMEQAGISDQDMISRLERTQQYFALTEEQEGFLRDRGVNDAVIVAMRDMNREPADARLASEKVDGSKPIGRNAR